MTTVAVVVLFILTVVPLFVGVLVVAENFSWSPLSLPSVVAVVVIVAAVAEAGAGASQSSNRMSNVSNSRGSSGSTGGEGGEGRGAAAVVPRRRLVAVVLVQVKCQ